MAIKQKGFRPETNWMRFADEAQIVSMVEAKSNKDTGIDQDADISWIEKFLTNFEGGLYRLAELGEL